MAIHCWAVGDEGYVVLVNGDSEVQLRALEITRHEAAPTLLQQILERGLVELDAEGRPAEELGPSEDEPERRR